MDAILSSPLHSQSPPFRISPHPPFTSFRPLRNQKFIPKLTFTSVNITPPIRFTAKSTSEPSESTKEQNDNVSASQCLAKHLAHAVFCFAVGISALGTFRVAPAFATVTSPWTVFAKKRNKKGRASRNHEYSDCTERVLEEMRGLLRSMKEVRKGDGDMNKLKRALKAVKVKKEESETEIMERLYPQLSELREVKGELVKQELELDDQILKAKREYVMLKEEEVMNEEKKVRMERLERRIEELDKKYNEILEKVYEVEDEMSRRETVAFSYGILKISFIEWKCEQLVEKFKRKMRQKEINR